MFAAVTETTRYEQIMAAHSVRPRDLAARFAHASQAARAAVEVTSEREAAIRDVAAGVAGPALIGFVIWIQEQARRRGLRRLRFLSRDGQVIYELTRRLAPMLGADLDLEYVYSSRLTWSLAATQPERLAEAPWLFNSFIKSNAADVCARLGLPFAQYRPFMLACGVSLGDDARADQLAQAQALLRFVGQPEVVRAVEARIAATRRLVVDYAAQHDLAEGDTGLVDIGWTGRMVGSLILSLARFDGHPSSGVRPRKDVRSWKAWGRSPGAAARSRRSSRPRSWSCASAGTDPPVRSRRIST